MSDTRVAQALQQETRKIAFSPLAEGALTTPAEWYAVLKMYYRNNGLYDRLAAFLRVNGVWMQGMKPLRNPAHRAVEFHVAHLWPGSLPNAMPLVIKDKNRAEAITNAIGQVWDWSNWGMEKQLAARNYSNLGDLFIKVPTYSAANGTVTQVFLQSLDAENVIDFRKDARGFISYIRIDTYQVRETNDGSETYVRTEVWDKASDTYRVFNHTKEKGSAIKDLGNPAITKSIQEAYGFDFVPVVHAKFADVGVLRGNNCYFHALDKIDEANMMATRLHQMLFRYNKPTTVVMANAVDTSGRPLPPPTIEDRNGTSDGESPVVLGDEDIWELPGYSKLEHLVPNLQYADALAILQDQMSELEGDLPEILYYELKDKGEMSGKALQTLLAGAVDRAREARGNAEWALINAQKMALTIGQLRNLKGFEATAIGTFEDGSFNHSFQERDVIPLSKQDQSEGVKTDTESGMALEYSMKRYGFSEAEIQENRDLLAQQKKNEESQLGNLVLEAMRRQDQGIQ